MSKIWTVLSFAFSFSLVAQQSHFLEPSDSLNIKRRNAVIVSEAVVGATALIALDQLWYSEYDRSSFQTLNDNGDWFGMDKAGHVFSAYQLGRYGANMLNWSGVGKRDQLLYGATLGFTFLTAVEIMDGFSSEWGFSWGDMAANALGTGIYVGQQLLWEEQRISLKFSFHQTKYANINPSQLGQGFTENLFKDYNGQTYWLSFNMHSFFKDSFFPKWLNLSLGYGAEGMLNPNFTDSNLPEQSPYRQFYLSLDIDLTRIKTNSPFLKTLFDIFNLIKVPSPTLELDSLGRLKFHYIYF